MSSKHDNMRGGSTFSALLHYPYSQVAGQFIHLAFSRSVEQLFEKEIVKNVKSCFIIFFHNKFFVQFHHYSLVFVKFKPANLFQEDCSIVLLLSSACCSVVFACVGILHFYIVYNKQKEHWSGLNKNMRYCFPITWHCHVTTNAVM